MDCADQAEVDRLWDALSEGGEIEQCGWLKDRYGVSWQIVPTVLGEMMKDPDRIRGQPREYAPAHSAHSAPPKSK